MNETYIKKAENYIKDKTEKFGAGNLEAVLEDDKFFEVNFDYRIEGRTRDTNYTEALRLRVHDPLWMLARQWQMGEFRGNNAGSAVSVQCKVNYDDCSNNPIEPITEQINPRIDFISKIESAIYYLDLARLEGRKDKIGIKKLRTELVAAYPIDWDAVSDTFILPDAVTTEEEKKLNKHLLSYDRTYRGKIFDGSMLYADLVKNKKSKVPSIDNKFKDWYKKKYEPASATNEHWQKEDLCYEVETNVAGNTFKGDRYQGGRLSWYSFDLEEKAESVTYKNQKTVLSLPTPATFASAPNKRLWQMEDRKVFMGNSVEEPSEANSVVMRYTTMYANDWMLFPLETQIGKYITVNSINVIDTFGDEHTINGDNRAGASEKLGDLEEQWQMFTNSSKTDRKAPALNGLYYTPQLAATVEGKPIEEVKVLRDEMANMVWGVENVVPDGCGGTLDAELYATQLATIVNEYNEAGIPVHEPDAIVFGQNTDVVIEKNDSNVAKAKFSYQLQSSVPFNWIPFIPQRLATEDAKKCPFFLGGREMVLRRGKMPCYVYSDGKFNLVPVRPQGSIMRPQQETTDSAENLSQLAAIKSKNGVVANIVALLQSPAKNVVSALLNSAGNKNYDSHETLSKKEKPMFIHEEAVQATGIRLTKNYQRARWIGGQTYQWLGIYKRQAKTEASSGLVFDVLHEN